MPIRNFPGIPAGGIGGGQVNTTMAVKSRAIPMSGPMVRAILDGRKCQTRRTVKGLGMFIDTEMTMESPTLEPAGDWIWGDGTTAKCPYGAPGDHLYVTEHWSVPLQYDAFKPSEIGHSIPIWYRADPPPPGKWGRFRVGRFMCRWMSRITLEITNVRVQRLHDIGKDGRKAVDVLDEGVTPEQIEHQAKFFHADDSPALAYAALWESINGKGSWQLNPWIWALTFRRTTGGAL